MYVTCVRMFVGERVDVCACVWLCACCVCACLYGCVCGVCAWVFVSDIFLYGCVYVYMGVHELCVHVCTCVHVCDVCECVFVYVCACVGVCECVWMFVCAQVYVRVDGGCVCM